MSRQELLAHVCEAKIAGASRHSISELLEISSKTLTRWEKNPSGSDNRSKNRFSTSNKLTKEEERKILELISSPQYRDKTPMEIVALEAEKGNYIASERSIYRVMERNGFATHRSKSKAPTREKPAEFVATDSNQIWTWDITYLKTNDPQRYAYLYLIMDIWDRSIVGWSLHDCESGKYAADLLRKTCMSNTIRPKSLVIHQDNGSPMISNEFMRELYRWGISSYSRPGVSDDNPYSESLFKTLKYHRSFPNRFRDIENAKEWMTSFHEMYNHKHLHSGIGFITPCDRRSGRDKEKLEKRTNTYLEAKARNPLRWSKDIRKWDSPRVVYLNPRNKEKQKSVA